MTEQDKKEERKIMKEERKIMKEWRRFEPMMKKETIFNRKKRGKGKILERWRKKVKKKSKGLLPYLWCSICMNANKNFHINSQLSWTAVSHTSPLMLTCFFNALTEMSRGWAFKFLINDKFSLSLMYLLGAKFQTRVTIQVPHIWVILFLCYLKKCFVRLCVCQRSAVFLNNSLSRCQC